MKWTGRILAAIAICMLSFRQPAMAAPAPRDEYQVKAAFIYHFVQFIDWPAEALADGALIVAVVGEDPFDGALAAAVKDRKAKDRPMVYKHFANVDAIEDCHVLFISPSEKDRVRAVLDNVKDKPVLTVSDVEGFTPAGGMIQFFQESNKIRFEIRRKAAEDVKLQIRAKLLKVAKLFPE